MLTGGGPQPTPADSVSQKVYNLIPAQFDPLDNPYDDDKSILPLFSLSEVNDDTKELSGRLLL